MKQNTGYCCEFRFLMYWMDMAYTKWLTAVKKCLILCCNYRSGKMNAWSNSMSVQRWILLFQMTNWNTVYVYFFLTIQAQCRQHPCGEGNLTTYKKGTQMFGVIMLSFWLAYKPDLLLPYWISVQIAYNLPFLLSWKTAYLDFLSLRLACALTIIKTRYISTYFDSSKTDLWLSLKPDIGLHILNLLQNGFISILTLVKTGYRSNYYDFLPKRIYFCFNSR